MIQELGNIGREQAAVKMKGIFSFCSEASIATFKASSKWRNFYIHPSSLEEIGVLPGPGLSLFIKRNY